MKTKFIFAALMGIAAVACSAKTAESEAVEGEEAVEVVKTSKDYIPSKATKDSVSYLVGINFGSFIRNYDFGDLNYAQIVKGIKDFVEAEGNMRDPEFAKQFKINPEEKMNELFNAWLENRHNYKVLYNKEVGDAFLAKNGKKEGVVTTDSGLQYKIVESGNGIHPSAVDTVLVRYKGTTIDGEVFDEVKEDAEFKLNQVVAGWTEGIQLVGEGGKIELFIPADLGYGEGGNMNIEPNATLLFTVELVKVKQYVEPVVEETPEEEKK